ncbi:MAG: septation protein IspZ [Pseudomonadota bacterium]
MSNQSSAPAKLEGNEKIWVEFGPIIALFGAYALNGTLGPMLDNLFGSELFGGEDGRLYTGLAVFIPTFLAAFGYSVYRTRRVAPMLAVTGVIVIGLGILTFVFQDKRFFYVKPTIVYGLIAGGLAGGLLLKQNFLKIMFDGAIEMADGPWRTLTWRFVWFHVAAAAANEVLWRTLITNCEGVPDCVAEPLLFGFTGEAWWLGIKGFGFTLAYFAFIAANAPFLMKHGKFEGQAN